MPNQYTKTQVDYISIVEALAGITNDRYETYYKSGVMGDVTKSTIMSDFRTVGFMVGRQAGATEFIKRWIIKHPHECCVIHKDVDLQDMMTSDILERINYNGIIHCSTTVRTVERDNKRLVGNLDTDPIFIEEITNRIKYVIVDESSIIFSYLGLKRKDFNEWVHDIFGPDTLIIHVK